MAEIHSDLEISTCDPFKFKMDKFMRVVSICIVSIYMENSIRMKNVKNELDLMIIPTELSDRLVSIPDLAESILKRG